MSKRKVINIPDDLYQKVQEVSAELGIDETATIKRMIADFVLTKSDGSISERSEITILIDKVANLEKNYSWFQADDTQSKVGNLEHQVAELEKKINVLTSVSKLFKGHLKDRSIHLQD